jgi:hypothetical protein
MNKLVTWIVIILVVNVCLADIPVSARHLKISNKSNYFDVVCRISELGH